MPENKDDTVGLATLTVEVAPYPVQAGAEVSLVAKAVFSPACDATGLTGVLLDSSGEQVGEMELNSFEGETNSSDALVLSAPLEVGCHEMTLVLPGFEAGDVVFPKTSTAVEVEVAGHTVTLNVWGLPSAITSGSTARMHIGARCSCGCSLAGREITLHDSSGHLVGQATLGDTVWPKTEALYFAETECVVAGEAGLRELQARFSGEGLQPVHLDGKAQVGVRIVDAGQHVVSVQAFDRDKQVPLVGALVTMHPFRAKTDERGFAELRVPSGQYRLFVSARRYVSDVAELDVVADVTTMAQLAVEARPERM